MQPGAGGLIDHDRQQTILQRVVAENIRDLGADHRPEAVIQQCPRRVLARGAAAEVPTRDQDLTSLGLGAIQQKSGFGAPDAS